MTTSATDTLSAAFDAAVNLVSLNAINTFLPVTNGFLTNIAANPSDDNLVAQGLLVEPQLVAAFPNFKAEVITGLANQIKALMTAMAATLTAALAAPAVATPASPS